MQHLALKIQAHWTCGEGKSYEDSLKNRILKPFSPHYKFMKGINSDCNVNISIIMMVLIKYSLKIIDKQLIDTI